MMSTGCVEVSSSPIDSRPWTPGPTPAPHHQQPRRGNLVDAGQHADDNHDHHDFQRGRARSLRVTNFILPATPGVTADKVRSAKVTANIRAASTDGNTLWTSYDHYSFPSGNGVDAVCLFLLRVQRYRHGGKFDWWRTGGQARKVSRMCTEATAATRCRPGHELLDDDQQHDGKQRSNTCKVVWK